MLHLELIWMESHQVRYLLILQVKFLVDGPPKGHGGHLEVTNSFFAITWEPNEIETWVAVIAFVSERHIEWCIIWPTWVTEWPCPDLTCGQILTLTFQGPIIHGSTRPWRDKHDGIKIVALPLKLKIVSSKNRFRKFWNFDPWWPQFWPEPKNDRNDFEMNFLELSNAVFRFVLRWQEPR